MFQRQYVDEGIWEEISETDLREALARNYTDVDRVVAELRRGSVIRTPFVLYRMV